MFYRFLIVLLWIGVGLQASAELEVGEDGLPTRDMLELFAPYTGRWVSTIKGEATEANDGPYEIESQWEGRYILDGAMFQFRGVSTVEDEAAEFVMLFGYDRAELSYCCWYHDQRGMSFQSRVDWAEDGRSYWLLPMVQEEAGFKSESITYLVDEELMRFTFSVVSDDGTVLVKQSGESRPEPGEIAFPASEEAGRLAMFEAYTGPWHSVVKGKVTDVIEQPYQTTSDWQGRSILGGKAFEFNGTATTRDGDSYAYRWLYAYDESQEAFVCWYHESNMFHAKHEVVWNDQDRSLAMVPEDTDRLGFVPRFTTYLVDDQALRFTLKLTGNDGTLILDEVGLASPVPEQ